ncbi:MAG: pseudouridine synthase [Pseudomonadota bacterium]
MILLNKPFRVLSQFTATDGKATLADYVQVTGVYPAGRLDFDSEGLLLLTDNGALQAHIASPRNKTTKHYWTQVEGDVELDVAHRLEHGVSLKDGPARAHSATPIACPERLWERTPPVRFRKSVADHWLDIVLTEGRNRQVRRMTAAAGAPTLRLVRHRIGPWHLGELQPGDYRAITDDEAFDALRHVGSRRGRSR